LLRAAEPGVKSRDDYARATLRRILGASGIADPAAVLENIHLLGLKLEALHPELPAAVRQSIAVVTEAESSQNPGIGAPSDAA
jgi:hypothetical protein